MRAYSLAADAYRAPIARPESPLSGDRQLLDLTTILALRRSSSAAKPLSKAPTVLVLPSGLWLLPSWLFLTSMEAHFGQRG